MQNIKHVGKVNTSGANVLVVFRTLPGESDHCLVVPTAQLSDSYHDAIIKLVESQQAQDSFEFGEILFTRSFPDGRPMLRALQADNMLQKIPTDGVTMTPNPGDGVILAQLNTLIAEQRNCAISELSDFVSGAPTSKSKVEEVAQVTRGEQDLGEPSRPEPLKAKPNEVLTDSVIAKSYRSQADSLYKEAALLRKQADELDPPQKKAPRTSKKAETAVG